MGSAGARRGRRSGGWARATVRRAAVLTAFLFLSVGSGSAAKPLVVTFLDCGQGDATLLETPGGKSILIDAGPIDPSGGFDAGKDVVGPFLVERKISALDVAVFSHPHLDHLGGFKHVLKNFPVARVYDPGYSYPSDDYKEVLELVQSNKRTHFSVVRSGQTLDWDPALKVRVLSPPTQLLWDNPNDNSLVIHVQHGAVSFLFMGDAEGEAEYEMAIRYGPALKSTVIKAGHHGSTTSSKSEFVDYVKPEVAVISCGRQNRFRHPSGKVVSRYEKLGAQVFRTDEQGNIRVVSDGKKYKVEAMGLK
jgi:competence protein ComEC